MIIPISIIVIVLAVLVILIILIKGGSGKTTTSAKDKIEKKGRNAVIKEAEKKLAHDPHNVLALQTLGELYFSEKNWEKSFTIYKTLYDISAAHVEISIEKATLRMGIAACNLDKLDDAINALLVTMKRDSNSYEAAYYLGSAFYKKGIYDKAIYCLKRAHTLNPSSTILNEPLGFALFKAQKYRDCLPFLKRVLDEHPENKEAMFDMAAAMTETGMADKALKVFMHLRPDPQFGAQSCLEAGKIHQRTRDYEKAIQDYEISFKLQNVPEQISTQIKYNCAACYIQQKNIAKALGYLKQVQNSHPGYKDVDVLVARYSELNQNSNLQTYLMAGTSDFVALCRKFIQAYYPKAFVKIEDVSVQSESIEITCNVENGKWSGKELFRFYRTSSVMGDIYVRDFHSKLRDTKADKGTCVTMGTFSESAHKFIDGRPIDLIEKETLSKVLKKISVMG